MSQALTPLLLHVIFFRRQEDHHRKVSFQDELLSLLEKNEIEFEEGYLWS